MNTPVNDNELMAVYQSMPKEEPSAKLDQAIRDHAHQSVKTWSRPGWVWPISMAAATVLCAGLFFQLAQLVPKPKLGPIERAPEARARAQQPAPPIGTSPMESQIVTLEQDLKMHAASEQLLEFKLDQSNDDAAQDDPGFMATPTTLTMRETLRRNIPNDEPELTSDQERSLSRERVTKPLNESYTSTVKTSAARMINNTPPSDTSQAEFDHSESAFSDDATSQMHRLLMSEEQWINRLNYFHQSGDTEAFEQNYWQMKSQHPEFELTPTWLKWAEDHGLDLSQQVNNHTPGEQG